MLVMKRCMTVNASDDLSDLLARNIELILVQPPGGLRFNPISGLGTKSGGGLFAKPIPYCFRQPRPLEKHIPWHAATFYTAVTSAAAAAAAAVACTVVVVDVHCQITATGI